jgi:hypothetical protein
MLVRKNPDIFWRGVLKLAIRVNRAILGKQ